MLCLEKNIHIVAQHLPGDSQCSVSDYDWSIRLPSESIEYVGSHRAGHVCLTSDSSAGAQIPMQWLPTGLVPNCQSTLEQDRSDSVQLPGPHFSGGTSLEDTVMVPSNGSMYQWWLNRGLENLTPQLAVWLISGRDTKIKTFQRKLPHSCSILGGVR